mmetsp:Transcript_36400/g.83634  ORF Transcript_36400/g.83634 Transcript_36400/m.83634 type:complete len:201 (+) Transcript_36400:319-921(+)
MYGSEADATASMCNSMNLKARSISASSSKQCFKKAGVKITNFEPPLSVQPQSTRSCASHSSGNDPESCPCPWHNLACARTSSYGRSPSDASRSACSLMPKPSKVLSATITLFLDGPCAMGIRLFLVPSVISTVTSISLAEFRRLTDLPILALDDLLLELEAELDFLPIFLACCQASELRGAAHLGESQAHRKMHLMYSSL